VQNNHFKNYKHILVPYFCKDINHSNRIIFGNFIWPMWNTIERTILLNGAQFNHTYITGKDFTIEYKPTELKNYHISNKTELYYNKVLISDAALRPNSILLFQIPSDAAKPFIENNLL
jgi:hypothetical protein